MCSTYARLIKQIKFIYQAVFLGRFGQQDEVDQVIDETDWYVSLTTNQNLTQSDFDNFDIRSQLKHQNQNQESKQSGWGLRKIIQWQYIGIKLLN